MTDWDTFLYHLIAGNKNDQAWTPTRHLGTILQAGFVGGQFL